jgi:integrase
MSVRSTKVINDPVWIESQHCWQIKVRKNGKRATFRSYDSTTAGKVECRARAKAWKEDNLINASTKVSKLADKWIEELKVSVTRSGWNNPDQCVRNYLKPLKGNKKIGDLSEQDLQDVILHAFKHPIRGKELSAKTLKNIMDSLKAFVKYARKCNACSLHPEDLTVPKTARKSNKGTLQPNDIIKLFSSDKTSDHKKIIEEIYINAFRYEVVTGHRPGELFGLMKSDIKGNVCRCNRAINVYGEFTDGKNENARRTYEIPPLGMEVLNDQKILLKKLKIKSLYIFPAPDGGPIKPNTYYKHWIRYRDFHGMSKRTPYEMRHTWFSVNKELPIELLKAMGGQGEDFDTMGVYGHVLNGEAHKTAILVDEKFKAIIKRDPDASK